MTKPVFVASDSTELYLTKWIPKSHKQRANIILMHGFNEYAGSFDEVGKYFANKNVKVWAYDQRGFGRNDHRGLWFGHHRMAEDLREFARLIKKTEPNVPLFVVGMSMGGAVSLVASAGNQLEVDGLVLVAPAVWTRKTQPFYQRWGLSIARKLFPYWSPSGKGLKIQATDNIPMLRKIWKSPYMIRKTRMDTLAGLVDLMDAAHSLAEQNPLPVLLLYGEKDELVPKKPTLQLWEKINKEQIAKTESGKKSNDGSLSSEQNQLSDKFIQYDNGWHMLMRDLNGSKVMDDIIKWIESGK